MKDNGLMHNDDQRLRAMLREDTGSEEEAEALQAIVSTLRDWQTEPASDAQRQALTRRLDAAVDAQFAPALHFQPGLWWPFLILRAQFRIVQRDIWAASALMFMLGGIVTAFFYGTTGLTLPFTIFAPLIAAVGLALIYNAEIEEAMEIERAMPAPLSIIMLARLTLVFGFDTLLGMVISIILSLLYPALALWPLVISWFAPMTFLAAFAFFISVLSSDAVTGVTLSFALWGSYSLWRYTRIPLIGLEDGWVRASLYPWLMVSAVVMMVMAIWITNNVGRIQRRLT